MAQKEVAGLKPGSKVEGIYNWIKGEMLNDTLLFTGEHAERVMAEFHVLNQQVWNILQRLDERYNLIRRKKNKREDGGGFIISLPVPDKKTERKKVVEAPQPEKPAPVGHDFVPQLQAEVDELILWKAELDEQIAWKQTLISELTKKGGK